MNLTITNSHKNPITLHAPWLYAENEDAYLALGFDRRSLKAERVMIDLPRDLEPGAPADAVVTIGLEWLNKDSLEFFVDVSSDREESTERVYSRLIEGES